MSNEPNQASVADKTSIVDGAVESESLIEDVSIDGMCGVY